MKGTVLAIAAGCLAVIAAIWATALERVAYERAEAVREAERRNENLALAFEEHTVRTLKAIDQALRFLRHEYDEQKLGLRLERLVENRTIDLSVFTHVDILDQHGDSLFARARPRLNGADRPFFKHHRDSASDEILISPPTIGRVTGTPVMHVTLRVERPGGGFGGLILASVDPGYFSSFYQHIDVGSRGMIQLVGLDGIVRARRVGDRRSFGEDMTRSTLLAQAAKASAGSFVSRGLLDGVPRFMSYRTVRGYPVVVAVSSSVEETLADFGKRARSYHAAAAVASLLALLLAGALMAALWRRQTDLEALTRSEARYRAAFNQAAVGIAHTAPDGRFIKVNRKFCSMLGYAPEELAGRPFLEVLHPDDAAASAAASDRLLAERALPFASHETRHLRKDGSVLWAAVSVTAVRGQDGNIDYLLAIVQDITEGKEAQAKLVRQAHYDALTELPNRALFHDRLGQAIAQAERGQRNGALMLIDLDRFKAVNDTFGHPAGDALLREAARRIGHCVRGSDTVARLGGDEFAIILTELTDPRDASLVAEKVLAALSAPYPVKGREIFVGSSIGVATFPRDGRDEETLVRNADAAMLRAKELGRDNFQFYTAAMNERALEELLLGNDLRRALERGEFFLEFQPIASLSDGRLAEFEALLRWRHPERGVLGPARFVPLLESSGLIAPVGEWVVRAACRQLAEWQRSGLQPVRVAVNLSARQLTHRDICAMIERELRAAEVKPSLLGVEVTESDAMANADQTAAILEDLRARGVSVAIDDFGTGYSSLAYLKRFPVTTLKLDRSFVAGLPGDPEDASIARAVISMAHSLGLKVVAEGVEHQAQQEFLAGHGCDYMQGYLLSRPRPAAEAGAMLERAQAAAA